VRQDEKYDADNSKNNAEREIRGKRRFSFPEPVEKKIQTRQNGAYLEYP
jgi:hypothetical protein